MHTTFEIVIAGEQKPEYAEQAAFAAFDELDRLERELSRFVHVSDVARVNALKPGETIRLGEPAFECLALAQRVWQETGGAFDVTLGALKDYWCRAALLQRQDRAAAKARMGMARLELHPSAREVRLNGEPVSVDLGAVGKGHAVDRMVELLREWSIAAALVHGGESSIYGMGAPTGAGGWKIAVANPRRPSEALRHVLLRDRSLSASSAVDEPHIIAPRTGRPARGRLGAWALASSAALADALSTAFFVMSKAHVAAYCQAHPDCAALCATARGKAVAVQAWNWP